MQKILSRDISWLHFNGRVLQEAEDSNNLLYDRLKFLAIYSSNLDEFYTVRIPYLRNFDILKSENVQKDTLKPKKVWREVQRIIDRQQRKLGSILTESILPALSEKGIDIIPSDDFTDAQIEYLDSYYNEYLAPHIRPNFLKKGGTIPFLKNQGIYLVIWFKNITDSAGLIDIPSDSVSRWITVPSPEGSTQIAYLDDVIRVNIHKLYPDQEIEGIYSIKLSRDAELYIQNELEGDLTNKIIDSLGNRENQAASRCLYDKSAPSSCVKLVRKTYNLSKSDMVEGGRYHNLNDFFSFPKPKTDVELSEAPWPPCKHPVLHDSHSLIDTIQDQDELMSFPYQSFEYIPKLLREAALHPKVSEIKITLYRVSGQSEVAKALELACQNGKKVTAFIEVKARFDEESNYYWGSRLKEAGAHVLYSIADIKVHSKIALIKMSPDSVLKHTAYLGTGNFNEKTATLYTDQGLLTTDPEITESIDQVFNLLERKIIMPRVGPLLISPFNTRTTVYDLIENEMVKATAGKPAAIILKMNSLEDSDMIYKLYEASQAGVPIKCIIRGMCCLIPGVPGLSDNIEVRSIVDRFLEHSRIYMFGTGSQQKVYLASADWMTRNLDRRIEVCFPIKDQKLKKEVKTIINYQLKDNVKARNLANPGENAYFTDKRAKFRSQLEIYRYYSELNQKDD